MRNYSPQLLHFARASRTLHPKMKFHLFFSTRRHVDGGPAGRHNHSGVSQWGRNPPHANTMEITRQHNVSALLMWCSGDSAVQFDSRRLMLILCFDKNIHYSFLARLMLAY